MNLEQELRTQSITEFTKHDIAVISGLIHRAREEERSRIEIELMSAPKHSHPGDPKDNGLYLDWSDLKQALTPPTSDKHEEALQDNK